MTPHTDAVIAAADLADRAGASGLEIGFTGDPDGPMHEARWYAHAQYRGARIIVEEHTSPAAAATALAIRLLTGATCRCGQAVTLTDAPNACRWTLEGKRWEPGCTAPAIRMVGAERGDHAAMLRALNRRQ